MGREEEDVGEFHSYFHISSQCNSCSENFGDLKWENISCETDRPIPPQKLSLMQRNGTAPLFKYTTYLAMSRSISSGSVGIPAVRLIFSCSPI